MYVGFWSQSAAVTTQTPTALGDTLAPRLIAGLSMLVIPNTSGATTNAVVLTGVASGGGASGGQVSGLQFTIDPTTQKYIVGNPIAAASTVILKAAQAGDQPVNP